MKRLPLLLLLSGSCAHPVPLQQPEGPKHWMIPLEADKTDLVCAETRPEIPVNFCMSVNTFRILVIDPKVEP
jgi:hypothetical protein